MQYGWRMWKTWIKQFSYNIRMWLIDLLIINIHIDSAFMFDFLIPVIDAFQKFQFLSLNVPILIRRQFRSAPQIHINNVWSKKWYTLWCYCPSVIHHFNEEKIWTENVQLAVEYLTYSQSDMTNCFYTTFTLAPII